MAHINPRYARNPYRTATTATQATIYHPSDYVLSELCALSADGLRVLLVMANKIDPTTGASTLTTLDMRQYIARHSSNVRRVVAELIKQEFIARAATAHTYWINPKAFRVASFTS